ncbi:MAG: M6 family metalloprotease domain-containing protein [Bacteroidaceae bacterium]|nr:M6 family metalloprotease domain-containing protein [Bacteroidaceae bacterium]
MKRFSFFLMVLLVVVAAFAAPARRAPFKVLQSDGTLLTVVLTGDEAMHYYVTEDGKPLVKEDNGDFSYATFSSEGDFVSTKCLAHDNGSRTADEIGLISSIDYSLMYADIKEASYQRSVKYRAAVQRVASVPTRGDVNVAVLLVEFPDCKFTYKKEDIENILNTPGYVYKNPLVDGIGSARDYFMAQSDSLFKPNFVVSDIVTLDYDMSYYGANKANGDDTKPSYAIKHGIQKASEAGFDFSQCDNDGDGEVEFVYCLYAGYSESSGADSNTIWPHQWKLSAQAGSITVNGVKCDTYACSGELVLNKSYESKIGKVLAGIGLICHEFSHCLGLHDIYDTKGNGNWGMDYWDVMDQGNYTAEGYVPVGYSAYQRAACGWRELVEIDTKGSYSMEPLTRGGLAYKIVNDANSNEYYILENRKREGWDTYLFAEGMLVVHVDYLESAWNNNTINGTKGHPRYTLIPADNDLAIFGKVSNDAFVASLRGDVWPGTSGNTELTDTSIPAAKVYTGGYMGKPVTGIKYENDVISFDYLQGVFVAAPNVLPATDITSGSFVSNWERLDGASYYNVELYKVTEVSPGEGDAVAILTEDFMGCIKSNTDVSATINEYTMSDGWSGERIFSEGGVLRIGASSAAGYLKTPVMDFAGNVTVSFMLSACNANDSGQKLVVSIVDVATGEALQSGEFVPAVADAEYSISVDVDGGFYVLFATDASEKEKRVYVDNISVFSLSTVCAELVESIEGVQTCEYRFVGLESGCTYSYRVQAGDSRGVSGFSAFENVVLQALAVDEVFADDAYVEVYTLSGVRVYSGNRAGVRLDPGMYIFKSPIKAVKAIIR